MRNWQSSPEAKNDFCIEGDVVWVRLTQGQETRIDLADWDKVKALRWHTLTSKSSGPYAVHHIRRNGKLTAVLLHVLIAGDSELADVDHEDADGLNNRRYNLRPCTRTQNQANARLSKRNTSGFKGVSWHKGKRRFCAQIRLQGRLCHLGAFETAEEASHAYDAAALSAYGSFARLNNHNN